MIAVIFWGLLGIFALGFTIALLVLVQEGTVIANDGITVIIRLRACSAGGPGRRLTALYPHRQAGRLYAGRPDPAAGCLYANAKVEGAAFRAGYIPAVSYHQRDGLFRTIYIRQHRTKHA